MEKKETNGERTLRKRSRLQSHDKKNQAAFGNTIPKPSGEETISKASGGEANIQPSSGKTMRKRNRLQENNKELKQSSGGELRNQAAAQTKQASTK